MARLPSPERARGAVPAIVALLGIVLAALPFLRAPTSAAGDWMFDPTFREGDPGDVLEPGPPPLLRAELDQFTDLFEAAFQMALPRRTEQRLRDAWEVLYAHMTGQDRQAFAALVKPASALRAAARSGEWARVEEGLQDFRQTLDQRLSSAPDLPPHRLVRETLHAGRQVVWPGEPAIPAAAADSWLEMVDFVVSLATNQAFQPTAGQRDTVRSDLAASLHALSPALRQRLLGVYRPWLRAKAAWDAADVGRRLELRWKAVTLVAGTLPPGREVPVAKEGDLAAYAKAAAALAHAASGYELWSSLARQPAAVLDPLEAWLGPLPAEGGSVLLYRSR